MAVDVINPPTGVQSDVRRGRVRLLGCTDCKLNGLYCFARWNPRGLYAGLSQLKQK